MKKLLTRLWFLSVVSAVVVVVGLAMMLHTRQPLWIAVAGTVVTLLGAIAACRKFIRLGLAETWVSNVPISGGAILPTKDDLDHARQEDLDDRASILASVLIVIGTPLQICGYLIGG